MLQPESIRIGSNRNVDKLMGVADRSRFYSLETEELPIRRFMMELKPFIMS